MRLRNNFILPSEETEEPETEKKNIPSYAGKIWSKFFHVTLTHFKWAFIHNILSVDCIIE